MVSMKINHAIRCLATAVLGLAVSSAQPAGIVAAFLLLPAFTFRQPSRRSCYAAATGYYAGTLWPLAVGAKNFFGPDVPVVGAMAFWAVCAMLLALPYALLWTDRTRQLLWRAPVALLIGVIPPLGLIGFASPLTASGFLFPAWSWAGLALSLVGYGLITAHPRAGFLSFTGVALVANVWSPGDAKPPSDWQAVDTHFGAISHGAVTPLCEYLAAQAIQDRARASSARVVVFPESVVPRWTASTDLFWQPAIDALRRDGKIVLIGALVPESLSVSDADMRGSIDLLRTGQEPQPAPRKAEPYSYRNVAMIRGTQSGIFLQRVPVPISVWKPLSHGGAPLDSGGPAVVEIGGERAALLICYEQVIPWTVLSAALARPTLFVGMSNDHWATGTPIPQWQALCLRAWSRLFWVPYLLAVNT
jgi:apolipoprotein N-acyltransferase